jgi:hypothetical protein
MILSGIKTLVPGLQRLDVRDDYLMTLTEQMPGEMPADEPAAASYENAF